MAPAKTAAAKPKAKKANGYARPAAISLGTVLTDTQKKSWKVGPTIGSGGFGDIYSCCSGADPVKKTDDYPHVVKIEPHANGPLFVEMHFYTRNCKQDDIDKFRLSKGWKHLGMPALISHGSQDIHGERHRFLVIPRFGSDIWKLFLKNNRQIPQHTVYRIGIQMINVLEYMHSRGYVHADIKGANILLGTGKNGAEQCYLVDFGLANHYSTKEWKPDPKNAHNGTIEYTSRDAHSGVSTMRGDMEILGLNLVHWMGLELPWEAQKLLANPKKVQESKEQYMKSLDKQLSAAPEAIRLFMKNVERLRHDEAPDYDKFRGYLEKGLKGMGKTDKGALEFEVKKVAAKRDSSAPKASTSKTPTPRKRARNASTSPPPVAAPVVEEKEPARQSRSRAVAGTSKKIAKRRDSSLVPPASILWKYDEDKGKWGTVASDDSDYLNEFCGSSDDDDSSCSEGDDSDEDSSVIILDSPAVAAAPEKKVVNTPKEKKAVVDTPTAAEVRKKAQERRSGKLVVNNNITPKSTPTRKAKKTYEFNFELDVSMEADVVVNVKRKKKEAAAAGSAKKAATGKSPNRATPSTSSSSVAGRRDLKSTPSTPMSPIVRKRIARNVKVTPSGTVHVEKG